MPYVNEGDTDDSLETRTTSALFTTADYISPLLVPYSKVRSQYGWRSKGEKVASQEAFRSLGPTRWNDTRDIIDAMDRVSSAFIAPITRDRNGDYPVRQREYTEIEDEGMFCPTPYMVGPEGDPAWSVNSYLSVSFSLPSIWDEGAIRTRGGELMRRSRPAQPASGLAQFAGELRDFPRMFSRGSSGPITTKDIGSGHLGYVFGWDPFLSEIQSMADSIRKSRSIVNQFVEDSGKAVRRTRKEVLTNSSSVYNGGITPNTANFGWNVKNVSVSVGGLNLSLGWRAGLGNTNWRNKVQAVVNVNESVSSFAKFRYFAFDPDGFLSRYLKYLAYAEQVVGMSFNASVAYDLTPFTWMVDWFYDIGGFLSYQQSVADYSLAASQCGVVYNKTVLATVLSQPYYNTTGSWIVEKNPAWVTSHKVFQQRRYAGTPYDMGNNWDGFSPEQWFILGALGLTNGPGISLG